MPRVPGNNILAFPSPQIEDADLLMAAAIMDEQGRLFEPEPADQVERLEEFMDTPDEEMLRHADVLRAAETQRKNEELDEKYPHLRRRMRMGP